MRETRDPSVVRRLCAAASHIAEKRWLVEIDAPPEVIAMTVDLWQAWWARHRNKYTEPVGAERLLAPILQTRYVLWLQEAVRTRFGRSRTGIPLLSILLVEAPLTLGLLATGLLLGSFLGLASASVVRASSFRHAARAARLVALCSLAVPTVTWLGWLGGAASSPAALTWATIVVLSSSAAIAHLHAKDALDADPTTPKTPTLFRGSWLRARAVARQTLRSVTANAPAVLGIVLLVEYGFDLRGWGRETIRAVLQRDVGWLMLMVMATATVLGLVHVLVAIGQSILGSDGKEADHNV
jgi:ABC-type dipeptide/oligopeptide/nickel transport system permease component